MPEPYIPETITVHLGRPDSDADDVTVPFVDYIKNVASSEIYPTWPENALRANIYAITTFALNRIYTEWYRSRGYNFDITNTTAFDQAFVPNRDIFENISNIVNEVFNDYVVRQGSVEPLFTQFCNGTTATCDGLSQWGTVQLAENGLTPYEILQYYYGEDIDIVRNAPVEAPFASFPGYTLSRGMAGREINVIQQELNRIAQNYPAISRITNVNGVYDGPTEQSVRDFQTVFDMPVTGRVDKATWYAIKRYFTAVKRLGELNSEGLTFDEAALAYPDILRIGSSGAGVEALQYLLSVISYFNPSIDAVAADGDYGASTENSVKQFQRFYGIEPTGNVGAATWAKLLSVYTDVLGSLPSGYEGNKAKLYPGYYLAEGQSGPAVTDLQSYLVSIAEEYGTLTVIPVTGYYGSQTKSVVQQFQQQFGLPVTGAVGPVTWYRIAEQYDLINER